MGLDVYSKVLETEWISVYKWSLAVHIPYFPECKTTIILRRSPKKDLCQGKCIYPNLRRPPKS